MFRRSRPKSRPVAYVIAQHASHDGDAPVVTTVRAKGARARANDRARLRILMCAVVFVFLFASLGVRLAFVSLGDAPSAPSAYRQAAVDAPRPEIIDRMGALLATDLPVIALEIAGREVWDADETAARLKSVLPDLAEAALAPKLTAGRYVEVRSDLSPVERQAIFDLGLPGVRFASRTRRFYPQADLAAHVIGHGELGKGGVMGLERVANAYDGERMRATIDIRVQQIVEDELAAAIEKFKAVAGWGAVMDAETGEIIALASLPDFDPNDPGAAPTDFRRNRATYDQYELGSAFKAITAASALEAGIADETSTYDARGGIRVADRLFNDFHGENRVLSFSEVVQHSSNIGIIRIATDLGVEKQKAYLRDLGLFDALPIELAENRGVDLPAKWGPVEAATVSFGHGIAVTPLHLLAAFNAVVNGGTFISPTFVKSSEPAVRRRVFSEETSIAMRRVMRRVLTDGTASFADVDGYYPIGKTATADKRKPTGGYDHNNRISSFVGAIPGYAPRYTIIVSLDEPKPLKETYGYATAGWNAAPTFARIVKRAAPILGIAPTSEETALAAFVASAPTRYKEAALEPDQTEPGP